MPPEPPPFPGPPPFIPQTTTPPPYSGPSSPPPLRSPGVPPPFNPAAQRPPSLSALIQSCVDGETMVVSERADSQANQRRQKFETIIGTTFPPDYAEFLGLVSFLHLEVAEHIWPRPQRNEVRQAWAMGYGFTVYGIGHTDAPEFDLRVQTMLFWKETGTRFVPFLKGIFDLDPYIFDSRGKVFRWDHLQNFPQSVNATFTEVLQLEIAQLRQKRERMKLDPAKGRYT